MSPICSLLDKLCQSYIKSYTIKSSHAKSFDALNQSTGFVLYETYLPAIKIDPARFIINMVKDRAYVYVNKSFIEVLSRENAINSVPINMAAGNHLQVLLENEGRLSHNFTNDKKGILGYKKFGLSSLRDWEMTGFPFDNYTKIEKLIKFYKARPKYISVENEPVLLHGEFFIENGKVFDTYLDTSEWGKVCFTDEFEQRNNSFHILSGFCICQRL